jgi:hypothetical protein
MTDRGEWIYAVSYWLPRVLGGVLTTALIVFGLAWIWPG